MMDCPFNVQKNGKYRFKTPAALWVLNPARWNRHALRDVSYKGGIIAPEEEALKGHRSTPDFSGMKISPVAVLWFVQQSEHRGTARYIYDFRAKHQTDGGHLR